MEKEKEKLLEKQSPPINTYYVMVCFEMLRFFSLPFTSLHLGRAQGYCYSTELNKTFSILK